MLKYILALNALFLFACTSKVKTKYIGSELIKNSKPSDWRSLDLENTIYLELKSGQVVIELAPHFAPAHVKNIKQIVANKYWDGLAVIRSQDNYVVQWGAPDEKAHNKRLKKLKNVKQSIKAEFETDYDLKSFVALPDGDVYAPEVGFSNGFAVGRSSKENKSWMIHCYGAVGVSRSLDINSGNGTSLYVVTGHSPRHLDRNITVVGRVVSGMEHLSTLPRGKGPLGFYQDKKKNVPIKTVRLASKLPGKKRVKVEVMRTDTELFKNYIESRRYRHESWFHHPTGKIEICNVPRETR